jgi:trigger factor
MNERLQDMAMRLQAQGLSLEQWLQFSGTETDQFLADLRETAERSAKVDLALRAVAVAETIEALEEELEDEFAAVAARVDEELDTVRTQLTEAGHIPALRSDVSKRKALEWLTETVTIVDEDGNAIAFADLALDEADVDELLEAVEEAELIEAVEEVELIEELEEAVEEIEAVEELAAELEEGKSE